jgi:hypothetical protein
MTRPVVRGFEPPEAAAQGQTPSSCGWRVAPTSLPLGYGGSAPAHLFFISMRDPAVQFSALLLCSHHGDERMSGARSSSPSHAVTVPSRASRAAAAGGRRSGWGGLLVYLCAARCPLPAARRLMSSRRAPH